ncbi:MAG: DUF805 domain-containing protein [Bacteroidales bacterium]|nr:DUF805 domain-containing protein [Bacteroidales bacterium]
MNVIKIGRAQDNDYIVSNPMVSGHHADIVINDEGCVFYEDHSTNGTMINGQLVHNSSMQLFGSEVITLPGDFNFTISDIVKISPQESTGTIAGYIPNPPVVQQQEKEIVVADNDVPVANPAMSFGETFKYFFAHYTDFSGRARRSEYWYMALWDLIFSPIYPLWFFATIIPKLALFWRRMHDIGKSGWMYLLCLIPFIGAILIFIFLCTDSQPYQNQYGPSPKYSK